jgi:HlyD family secretion protein
MKTVFAILVLLGVAGGGAAYYAKHRTADPATSLRTVAVKRGDLLSTIGATGTVEPEEVVDVGAQVAGLIVEFGADPHDPAKVIDYGSVVQKGTVLARIDSTPYEAALDQAKANLQQAEGNQIQLDAKLCQAQRDWERAKKLILTKSIADLDYDTAQLTNESGRSGVAVGRATIAQMRAALKMAVVNLGYTTITSPVRGVIIDRRVNIGQTVVASLNAPSLFLIAKDLRRMQVWASVNEADIGHIRVDMPVRFTVDAHSGETFHGKVTQIRMNATMTQNVVTYTVVVTTDNPDGKLLPYLTANVQFEVDQRSDVLLVPSAALRWKPQSSQVDPALRKTTLAAESTITEDHGCLWVEADGGFVRPLEVVLGASDGTMTEISGSGVKEGIQVVVAEEGKEDTEGQDSETPSDGDKTSNPFLPKPPKGSKPPPGPM